MALDRRFPLTLVLVALAIATGAFAAEPIRATIVLSADIHGYGLPTKDPESGKEFGGLASMAARLTQLRGGPAAGDDRILFLDAGDLLQGTLEDGLTQGALSYRLLQDPELDVDLRAIGNHDFDYGRDLAQTQIAGSRIPTLGANVLDRGTGKRFAGLSDSTLIDVGGIRYGVIGLIGSDLESSVKAERIRGLEFTPEELHVERLAYELRASGAEVVILLTHGGWYGVREGEVEERRKTLIPKMEAVAKKPESRIDLVLDGHSHEPISRRLGSGEPPICYVQGASYGKMLAEIAITLDPSTRRVLSCDARFTDLDVKQIPPSSDFLARHAEDIAFTRAAHARPIAHIDPDFVLSELLDVPPGANAAGNFFARAILEHLRAKGTPVHLALTNTTGVRGPIGSRSGEITAENTFRTVPFGNELVVVELLGKHLLELIDQSAGRLAIAGLEVPIERGARDGRSGRGVPCYTDARVEDGHGHLRPIDRNALYKVAMPDFAAESPKMLVARAKRSETGTGIVDREALEAYLSSLSKRLAGEGKVLDAAIAAALTPPLFVERDQRPLLQGVLERVAASAAAGKQPVVVFDLDSTLYDNSPRQRRIIEEWVKEKHPELQDLTRQLYPERIEYAPADTLWNLGIDRPELVDELMAEWAPKNFSSAYAQLDVPLGGAVDYVRHCAQSGAVVVYLSGRDEPRMGDGTRAALARDGFPSAAPHVVILKPDAKTDDERFKTGVFDRIRGFGEVVGFFDNEPGNCNAFRAAFPAATVVFVDTNHSPSAPALDDAVPRIKSFLVE